VNELVRQGLPASFFVAPAFIGGRSFWWDSLSRADSGGLDPATRDHALHELRGDDSAIRAWALSVGERPLDVPEFARAASEDDLKRAESLPGITLGSHTWSHPNLTRIPRDELATELARPLEWLRQRGLRPLPWIAYPYGYFNDDVARAAVEAGYEAALGISGGWYPEKPHDNYALPRVNIPPGVSRRGFALRGAGLLCG
jgi:peptidoglycan/xylan/chitin deacetylase (PgdA/CDA1 family)